MTIQLSKAALRKIFPRAPQAVLDADWQTPFDRVGISHTRTRLTYCLSNVEHECGGFTIRDLTENINYTAARAAQIWPSRFPGGGNEVARKYGAAPGWQKKMFNDVYGNRMGNRPGTDDGGRFIGRGGAQITGRNGYEEVGRRSALDLVNHPDFAAAPANQPAIIAAFWEWKKLNVKADAGDFKGCVKLWNGGQIGMADRLAQMAGNDPVIARLANVDTIMPAAKQLPGSPPTPAPPKDVVDATTAKERKTRTGAVATGTAGAANEGVVKTGTVAPDKAPLPPQLAYGLIAVGIAAVIVVTILIARKKAAVIKNWF